MGRWGTYYAANRTREVADEHRPAVAEERVRYEATAGQPRLGGQAVDAEGRCGLQPFAGWIELKNNRGAAADDVDGLLMQQRKQLAQPIGRGQGLEETGVLPQAALGGGWLTQGHDGQP